MRMVKIFTLKDFFYFFLPILFIVFIVIISLFYFLNSSLNRQAISFLKKKEIQKAEEYIFREIEKNIESPYPHLNLAFIYDLDQKPLKALERYQFLENYNSKNILFFSHFNQGELQARLGNIDKALFHYQKALAFSNNKNNEKKVRENIEFLFLKQKNSSQSKKENKEKSEKKSDSKKNQDSEKKNQDSENKNQDSEKKNQDSEKKNQDSEKEKIDSQNNKNLDKEEKGSNSKDNTDEKSREDLENPSSSGEKNQDEIDSKADSDSQENIQFEHSSEGKKSLNEAEKQIILNEIEKQESQIRAKQFQRKASKKKSKEKDW